MSKYHVPMELHPSHLFSTVGSCGTNAPEEVKKIQDLIVNAGYQQATGRLLNVSGQCGQETIEAIRWYQRLLNMHPSGLLHPVDSSFMEALSHALPGWRPKHRHGSLIVREGKFTFDNEGVDYITAVMPFRQPAKMPYFSRILHWPSTGSSGVTLGRGYDMGNRSRGEIFATLHQAGLEEYKANLCARAAGLKGKRAGEFVRVYGPLVGEITHQQQIRLFEITIKTYLETGRRIFTRQKINSSSKITWENMNPKIKDIYIDSIFQGCYSATLFAKLILTNDISAIRHYLHTDGAQVSSFGRNFKRARYINAL